MSLGTVMKPACDTLYIVRFFLSREVSACTDPPLGCFPRVSYRSWLVLYYTKCN